MRVYAYLLLNILLLVVGQTLWKYGLQQIGSVTYKTVYLAFLSPYIWLGLILYVIATGIWFIVISRINLSIAYPLQSLAYIAGVFIAWLVFKESIPFTRWLGVVVISLGVGLVALK